MVMAQKYKVGMYLGSDSIYFKEELPKKETGRSKRLIRQGIFVCPKCGKEFTATLQDVYTGHTRTCGCLNSKGELLINEILNYLNISYVSQKVFNGCINPKSKRNLRFDFYLPDYNTCIEYDGVQHYKILGWNDEKHFNEVVYRDSIKTKFCVDNNIHLIRIPYTDYDKIDSQYLLDKLGM